MACSSCGANKSSYNASPSVPNNNIHQQQVIPDCPYSLELIQGWLQKVTCFRDKGLYNTMPNITVPQINSYVGTILSALNYPTNICYFKDMLDEIAPFITVVISTELC